MELERAMQQLAEALGRDPGVSDETRVAAKALADAARLRAEDFEKAAAVFGGRPPA